MLNRRSLKEFVQIVVGLAIVAAAVYFFMLPYTIRTSSPCGNILPWVPWTESREMPI